MTALAAIASMPARISGRVGKAGLLVPGDRGTVIR